MVKELTFRKAASTITLVINYLTGNLGFYCDFPYKFCLTAPLFQNTSQWILSFQFIFFLLSLKQSLLFTFVN